MTPVGLPSVSSSTDPAHGTWAGARRSMRHANSPRPLRLILSPRRFRHTAVSPPPCTRRSRRTRSAGRNLFTPQWARFSHICEFRAVRAFRNHHVKDTAYPDAAPGSGPLATRLLHDLGPLVHQELGVIGIVALSPQVGDGVGRVRQREDPATAGHDYPYSVRGVNLVATRRHD